MYTTHNYGAVSGSGCSQEVIEFAEGWWPRAAVVKYQREKAATTAIGLLFRKPNANAVSVVFSTIPLYIYIYNNIRMPVTVGSEIRLLFFLYILPHTTKTHLTDCVHRPTTMVNGTSIYVYYMYWWVWISLYSYGIYKRFVHKSWAFKSQLKKHVLCEGYNLKTWNYSNSISSCSDFEKSINILILYVGIIFSWLKKKFT